MFRPIRTLISFTLLAVCLWFAFTYKLGRRTFAEHVDAISDTQPAQELMEGTRETVHPVLEEVKDRVLGEYVEAPTHLSRPSTLAEINQESTEDMTTAESSEQNSKTATKLVEASSKEKLAEATSSKDDEPSTAEHTKLPGRK